MMALLLPQWAPPESLVNVRQRQRSRKSARATHGAAESSTSAKAYTDYFKIPSTEPCCNMFSPPFLSPRKPVRWSSRLGVRRVSHDDVAPSDRDAAEWISRVLADNGVVEVDPVTMAEQMQHAKHDSSYNNHAYHHHHHGSSSEALDGYPSRSPGFPARVPLGVALAAGSAIALAVIALFIQALHKETSPDSSDSEGSNLTSSFKGKVVTPDLSSNVSNQAKESKEVLASSAAAGASFSELGNIFERNKTPSLSEGEKSWSQSKYDSVTPFFTSDRSATSYAKPTPPVSRWQEDKYKSIRPFFPDEVPASTESVTPFFPDEQGQSSQGKSKTPSSSNKTVTPFFADDQQGSKTAKGSASLESVPPFFPDEQQSTNGPALDTVAPFFPDEQQGRDSTGVSPSKDSVKKVDNVKSFFPDEQVGKTSGSGSSKRGSMWSQFWDGKGSSGAQRVSSASSPSEGKQVLTEMAAMSQGQHKASNTSGASSLQGDKETPEVARSLSSEELALLEDMKTEEEKRFAKMQALQAAFPALAIGAGAVGALVGVDGAFEMVGITATASFISYELLWANKRKELVDEISSITDHHKLFSFLQKRKIVKDDC